MDLHLILSALAEEATAPERPSVELLKYSAERCAAALENADDAVNMAFATGNVFDSRVANMLNTRGYTGVKDVDGVVSLKHNGNARVSDIRKELALTADVVVAGMMNLDYQAASLEHMYRKANIPDDEASINVSDLLTEAFGRVLEEVRDAESKYDIRTTTVTDQPGK